MKTLHGIAKSLLFVKCVCKVLASRIGGCTRDEHNAPSATDGEPGDGMPMCASNSYVD